MSYSRFFSSVAAVCALAGLLAASPATADDKDKETVTGLYGGAGFGIGTSDDPSDTDYAWRMNVWWRAHRYGGVEIGYIDAGHPDGEDEIDGVQLVLVPTMPLPMGFDLFGKIGGFFWDDSNFATGVGLSYRLPMDFGVRLDWDLLNVDDPHTINVLTLGVFYQFAKK